MDEIVDKSEPKSEEKPKPAEKPISLRPLEFKEAVANLIRVKPDSQRQSGRSSGGARDHSSHGTGKRRDSTRRR